MAEPTPTAARVVGLHDDSGAPCVLVVPDALEPAARQHLVTTHVGSHTITAADVERFATDLLGSIGRKTPQQLSEEIAEARADLETTRRVVDHTRQVQDRLDTAQRERDEVAGFLDDLGIRLVDGDGAPLTLGDRVGILASQRNGFRRERDEARNDDELSPDEALDVVRQHLEAMVPHCSPGTRLHVLANLAHARSQALARSLSAGYTRCDACQVLIDPAVGHVCGAPDDDQVQAFLVTTPGEHAAAVEFGGLSTAQLRQFRPTGLQPEAVVTEVEGQPQ